MKANGPFESMSLQWYVTFTPTAELKKLRSGFLLKEILDHFTNKMKSQFHSHINLWMYFAHDITISNMLNSLGLFEVFDYINHNRDAIPPLWSINFYFSPSASHATVLVLRIDRAVPTTGRQSIRASFLSQRHANRPTTVAYSELWNEVSIEPILWVIRGYIAERQCRWSVSVAQWRSIATGW